MINPTVGALSRGIRRFLAQTTQQLVEKTLNCKEKANHGHKYQFFEDVCKKLEKFSLNFSSCNPFPSWPSAAKDTC